ncbi:MAG: chemotaxis protein CheA [Candidatus Cloacimonetes bacterium]|nr:chemotaxis protein CheA [Candidatus Cloacimonadota bacterium]
MSEIQKQAFEELAPMYVNTEQAPVEPDTDAELFADDDKGEKSYVSDLLEDDLQSTVEDDEDDDIFLDFLQEANEYIEELETEVIELENSPTNKEIINNVFRPFHTLKGVSGFMGLKKLNKICHETESLLDMVRNDKLLIDETIIQGVLASIDTIKFIISQLDPAHRTEDIPQERVDQLIVHLRTLATETPIAAVPETSLESLTEFDDTRQETARKTKEKIVKVRTEKLDYLIDMVGELVINSNLVGQDDNVNSIFDQEFRKKLGQLNRTVSELQAASMAMRMVPVGAIFTKMKRVVRDYSQKTRKEIELVLIGEDTEIDRNIVENLYDPLVHMIRNSCDHGIEDAETRKAAGKPARGTITLHAYHKGSNIVIDVRDDGKGLDRERIYEKAVERGLAKKDEKYTDKQIFSFVMEAGFSTAVKVTNVSGRGVGMDVVSQALKNLGGRIEIDSRAGEGSTFGILLPLTLAIIEGMTVRVGGDLFILPVVNVKRTLKPQSANVNKIAGHGESYDLGDHLIPIAKLHKLFHIDNARDKWEETILIIVSVGDSREFGLQVDELVCIQDVVIKTLGEKFKNLKGVSGATIMGDGSVGLILDIGSLVPTGT